MPKDTGKARKAMSKDRSANASGSGEPAASQTAPARGDESGRGLPADYPGPALLVRADGSVIAANVKGAGLESLLRRGTAPEIIALIDEATARSNVVAGTVSLSVAKGDVLLEITVVPGEGDGNLLLLARDLTMERNLRSALVESRQRYKDLVEVSSDFAWEVGPEGTFVFVSPRGALGFRAEDLVERRPEEFVLDADEYAPLPFLSDHALENVEMWMRRADGSTACVIASSVPLKSEDGAWQGTRGICRDVTEERARETALTRARHREQLLDYIVNTIRDEVEPENMLATAATATARALGAAGCRIYRQREPGTFAMAAEYGEAEGIGGLDDLLARMAGDSGVVETESGTWQILATATRYRQTINGAICMWKAAGPDGWDDDNRILIGEVASQLGIANEQIANHEHIVKLSRTDDMTALLNRRAFFDEELPRRLKRLDRSGQTASLFYVDMDNFKRVNDVHGHQRGDEAILFLRDLLVRHSRPGDVVARLGGDEFAMWLDGITTEVATKRVETLIAASKDLRRFSGDEDHPLGLSIGVAMYNPGQGEGLEELLARADAAMYAVKHAGKGGFRVAPPAGAPGDEPSKESRS